MRAVHGEPSRDWHTHGRNWLTAPTRFPQNIYRIEWNSWMLQNETVVLTPLHCALTIVSRICETWCGTARPHRERGIWGANVCYLAYPYPLYVKYVLRGTLEHANDTAMHTPPHCMARQHNASGQRHHVEDNGGCCRCCR